VPCSGRFSRTSPLGRSHPLQRHKPADVVGEVLQADLGFRPHDTDRPYNPTTQRCLLSTEHVLDASPMRSPPLASVLWRLRRATTMETGLFEIQADYLRKFRQGRKIQPKSQEIIYARFGQADSDDTEPDRSSHDIINATEAPPGSGPKSVDPDTDLAHCFLRLANLPSYPLDRLSRYEAILWRQAGQILFALDALDRRKPQDRRRRFHVGSRQELPADGRNDY